MSASTSASSLSRSANSSITTLPKRNGFSGGLGHGLIRISVMSINITLINITSFDVTDDRKLARWPVPAVRCRTGRPRTKRGSDERRLPAVDGERHLRGPLHAVGAGQLVRLRHRLLRRRRRLGRPLRHPAPLGDVDLLDVLLRRGPGRRHARPLHHRRADRGAVLLPRHPAGRRGPPLALLPPLLQRGDRGRRREHPGDAGVDAAAAELGLPRRLRPARPDGASNCGPTPRCRSTRRRSRSTT